jgi:hypothetical protein
MWITKQELVELQVSVAVVLKALTPRRRAECVSEINTIGLHLERLQVRLEVESEQD